MEPGRDEHIGAGSRERAPADQPNINKTDNNNRDFIVLEIESCISLFQNNPILCFSTNYHHLTDKMNCHVL